MLFNLIKSDPDILRPNTEVHSIFGIFPGSIWNGGGISVSGSVSRQKIQSIITSYNEVYNIPLAFTFTNQNLNQMQYYDTYSNIIAEEGHNGKNYIIVADPHLEEYLRKNYPNYKYCRSIIAAKDKPYILDDSYDLSVMRRNKNNDWNYLEQIPLEDRTHIEFLCNDPCPDDCPRLYTHYKDYARAQSRLDECGFGIECTQLQKKGKFQFHHLTSLQTYISREMIDEQYLPLGFNKIKCY